MSGTNSGVCSCTCVICLLTLHGPWLWLHQWMKSVDGNALFMQFKSLDSFHRSILVSRDTVAPVNALLVDDVPVNPKRPDSVNQLASALVNATDLGQGCNSRRSQPQQSRFDRQEFYKYPIKRDKRGGNRNNKGLTTR
jgi:hypothetical protein